MYQSVSVSSIQVVKVCVTYVGATSVNGSKMLVLAGRSRGYAHFDNRCGVIFNHSEKIVGIVLSQNAMCVTIKNEVGAAQQ